MRKAETLFEVSWEICNKVGGIHTVVKSKANNILNYYGDDYIVIGPYFHKKVVGEFMEGLPDATLKQVFKELSKEGIVCHFGKWLVDGEPKCILIDFSGFTYKKDEIKGEFWNKYKIDSLFTQYYDYDEPIIWSYAAGKLIEEYYKKTGKKIVAQFHEWLSAGALLYLKSKEYKIGTVFTTHATMLGRTLASSNIDIYKELPKINPEEEARRHGIIAKHQTEVQATHASDIFTTVSEITGMEAKYLLGREPDILLPNGLNLSKFPSFDELTVKHKLLNNKIKEFVQFYFFPYYKFDINKTLVYFLCGRYEFHDKGIDLLIKALGKLNAWLKENKSDKTIVTFFWVPGNIRGIKPCLLENKTYYNDIKDLINDEIEQIKQRIINAILTKQQITQKSIFGEELSRELRKKVLRFNKKGSPPLSTHDLYDESNDLIIKSFRENKLLNKAEDKVKVVFYSIYLTGADGLLDTSYYESMMGSDLGVFPSYYEPWGYTPLEAAALGIVSVTTDASGFGRYVKSNLPNQQGIKVLRRIDVQEEKAVDELFSVLKEYASLPKEKQINLKLEARNCATLADWKILIKNYINAHNMAFDKVFSKTDGYN